MEKSNCWFRTSSFQALRFRRPTFQRMSKINTSKTNSTFKNCFLNNQRGLWKWLKLRSNGRNRRLWQRKAKLCLWCTNIWWWKTNIINFVSSSSTCHYLANSAFSHKLAPHVTDSSNIFYTRDVDANFDGICTDNGAQKTVAGYEAYEKYCTFAKTSVDITASKELYKFGNHVYPSVGLILSRFPIDDREN